MAKAEDKKKTAEIESKILDQDIKETFDVKEESIDTLEMQLPTRKALENAIMGKPRYFNAGTSIIILDSKKEIKPNEDIEEISDFDIARFTLNGSLGLRK